MKSWQDWGPDYMAHLRLPFEQIDAAANVVKELNTQSEIVYKEKQEAMKKLQTEKNNIIDDLLS